MVGNKVLVGVVGLASFTTNSISLLQRQKELIKAIIKIQP